MRLEICGHQSERRPAQQARPPGPHSARERHGRTSGDKTSTIHYRNTAATAAAVPSSVAMRLRHAHAGRAARSVDAMRRGTPRQSVPGDLDWRAGATESLVMLWLV